MPDQKDSPPPSIKGVVEADYQGWRHHPVSKVVLQYLKDYHLAMKEEAWHYLLGARSGKLDPEHLGEISGRAKAAWELADLPFEALVAFYQKEENDAA